MRALGLVVLFTASCTSVTQVEVGADRLPRVTLYGWYDELAPPMPVEASRRLLVLTAEESKYLSSEIDLDAVEGIEVEVMTVEFEDENGAPLGIDASAWFLEQPVERRRRLRLDPATHGQVMAAVRAGREVELPVELRLDGQADELPASVLVIVELQPILKLQLLEL